MNYHADVQRLRVENILACRSQWAGPVYSSATQLVPTTDLGTGDMLLTGASHTNPLLTSRYQAHISPSGQVTLTDTLSSARICESDQSALTSPAIIAWLTGGGTATVIDAGLDPTAYSPGPGAPATRGDVRVDSIKLAGKTWSFEGSVGIAPTPWAGELSPEAEIWQVRAQLPPMFGVSAATIDAELAVTHTFDDQLLAEVGCHPVAVGTVLDLVTWEYGRMRIGGDTFVVDELASVRASLHRPRVVATKQGTQVSPALASHLLGCAVWTVIAEVTGETTRLVPVRTVPQFAAELTETGHMFAFTGRMNGSQVEVTWREQNHVH